MGGGGADVEDRNADGAGPSPRTERLGLLLGLAVSVLMLVLPPPAGLPPEGWRVAAVGALMAIWWVSEAVPLAVTAFLPFVLFPLLGVAGAGETAADYFSTTIFLLLGGAFLATAIEKAGLHRRVAMALAARGGGSPFRLVLAFGAATAFVSMFVSNTSTALIMTPVALAVVRAGRLDPRLAAALVLAVAYGATIGGLGTLVGSPTNLIAAGLIERVLGIRVGFLDWAKFGLPIVILGVPLMAAILMRSLAVPGERIEPAAIAQGIGRLGPLSSLERRVIPVVAALIGAWVLAPAIKPLFGLEPVDDSIWVMIATILFFALPGARGEGRMLTWDDCASLPWGVIMMFGGGLALAAAITDSGLAIYVGEQLKGLGGLPPIALIALIVLVVVLVTEFASNVATAAGFLPVVAAVALATGFPPLALAMPAALAASWGFMMPAGTGPNAIAYASGQVSVRQMVRAGLWLDLLGVPLIVGVCWAVG